MKRQWLALLIVPLLVACGSPRKHLAASARGAAPTPAVVGTAAPALRLTPLFTVTPTSTLVGGSAGQIAFASPEGVFILNADGSERRLLPGSVGNYVRPFAWSPDGRRIAFSCWNGICVKDLAGVMHVCPTPGFGLAWSPDGTRLAFSSLEPYYELRAMNVDCTGSRRLAPVGADPVWSPDSQHVAFVSPAKGIYVVRADGAQLRRLAPAADGAAFSPDGARIVFTSYDDGAIHVINADGTARAILAERGLGEAYLLQPIWSPDGAKIAYAPARIEIEGGPRLLNTTLYVMNADGSEQRALVRIIGRRYAWSPDGRTIAVSADVDGQQGIHLVRAEGAVQVTPLTAQAEQYPAWRPLAP